MTVEELVSELRTPNPPRGTAALAVLAADKLEMLELKVFRLQHKLNAAQKEADDA